MLQRYGPLALLAAFAVLTLGLRWALFAARTGRSPLARSTRTRGTPQDFIETCMLVNALLAALLALARAAAPRTPAELGRLRCLEHPALWWSGAALALVALAWTYIAQGGMGRSWRIGIPEGERPELITGGLFRFCRNPIYLGMLAAQLGLLLMLPATATALVVLFSYLLIQLQIRHEEAYLTALHGEAYLAFCRRTGRLLPWTGRGS